MKERMNHNVTSKRKIMENLMKLPSSSVWDMSLIFLDEISSIDEDRENKMEEVLNNVEEGLDKKYEFVFKVNGMK